MRDLARPVKPGAYRPDRDIEHKGNLLVTEIRERIEKQRIALARTHRRKHTRELRIKRGAVDPRRGVVLIVDPKIDAATPVGSQLTTFRPPTSMKQVRRDPKQPWQGAAARTAARAPLKGNRERLCSYLISEIAAGASMEVSVDGFEVPVEDRLERLRLTQ